jgi:hypothetical protein
MKFYHVVKKFLVGETQRQTGDLVSLLSFFDSRLIITNDKPSKILCKNSGNVQHKLFNPKKERDNSCRRDIFTTTIKYI